jgi:hypothetical protein
LNSKGIFFQGMAQRVAKRLIPLLYPGIPPEREKSLTRQTSHPPFAPTAQGQPAGRLR